MSALNPVSVTSHYARKVVYGCASATRAVDSPGDILLGNIIYMAVSASEMIFVVVKCNI